MYADTGEDTTAFTLACAVHQICDSPLWAAELRSEADCVIGANEVLADVDAASKLVRATAVANETMRLRPVAPFLVLESNTDTALGVVRRTFRSHNSEPRGRSGRGPQIGCVRRALAPVEGGRLLPEPGAEGPHIRRVAPLLRANE